jgi:hypothetical protein
MQHNHVAPAQPITDISYPARGRYTIRASAYDVFNDSLVARDSTVALIDSLTKSVLLAPGSFDSAVFQFPDGTVDNPIDLTVTTRGNADFLSYDFHITGMGIDTAIHANEPLLSFAFPLLGTYHLSVSVSDIDGRFYGKDTAQYNLKMKQIDPTYFTRMKSVGSFMKFQSQSHAALTLEGNSEFSNSMQVSNDSVTKAVFSQHSFTVYTNPSKYNAPSRYHDSLSATFSSDYATITSYTVSGHDTVNTSQFGNYTLTVGDAKLIAITRTSYIYAITGLPSTVFVRNVWSSYNSNIIQFQQTFVPFDIFSSFTPHLINTNTLNTEAVYIILHQ